MKYFSWVKSYGALLACLFVAVGLLPITVEAGTCGCPCKRLFNGQAEQKVIITTTSCTEANKSRVCTEAMCTRACQAEARNGGPVWEQNMGGNIQCVDREPTASTPSVTSGGGSSIRLSNPLGTTDLTVFIGRIIRAITGIVGAFALLMFVSAGIIWMTASDSKRIDQAKTIMKNASIGLFLIFLSYSIVSAFLSVFNL